MRSKDIKDARDLRDFLNMFDEDDLVGRSIVATYSEDITEGEGEVALTTQFGEPILWIVGSAEVV